jgi:hypothetical protein
MSIIVYPTTNYESFISVSDADSYFAARLHSTDWTGLSEGEKEIALKTAFNSLKTLDIVIDLTETDELAAIKKAQCEQSHHEIVNDLSSSTPSQIKVGKLSISLSEGSQPSRFAVKALELLRPYLRAPTVSRTR